MRRYWKVGVRLFTLVLVISICLCASLVIGSGSNWSGYLELRENKIHFWIERGSAPRNQNENVEDIGLALQVNNYFWTTERVFYFSITDLQNTGWRMRDTLIVDLTATNYFNRRIPLAFCYVVDVNDQKFEAVISNAIPFEESLFGGITIEPGGKVRGKLAFAVPKGHLPLWIQCVGYAAMSKIE